VKGESRCRSAGNAESASISGGRFRQIRSCNVIRGGDGGIRTLDRPLQAYNGLANRRLQPLGHVSVTGRYARRRGEPQAGTYKGRTWCENGPLKRSACPPEACRKCDTCAHEGRPAANRLTLTSPISALWIDLLKSAASRQPREAVKNRCAHRPNVRFDSLDRPPPEFQHRMRSRVTPAK
jgi:hypothetical protein